MKFRSAISAFTVVLVNVLFSLATFAQQEQQETPNSNDADTFSKQEIAPWYAQPWVWALVAAVVILFIFMITNGGKKKNMEHDSERGIDHTR